MGIREIDCFGVGKKVVLPKNFRAKKKRHPGGAAFRLVNLENMRTIIKELTLHFDLQLLRYEQICRLQNHSPKSCH